MKIKCQNANYCQQRSGKLNKVNCINTHICGEKHPTWVIRTIALYLVHVYIKEHRWEILLETKTSCLMTFPSTHCFAPLRPRPTPTFLSCPAPAPSAPSPRPLTEKKFLLHRPRIPASHFLRIWVAKILEIGDPHHIYHNIGLFKTWRESLHHHHSAHKHQQSPC